MKSLLFLYTVGSLLFLHEKSFTTTYRSDQFRPGLISEYIELTFSERQNQIIHGYYWSLYQSGSQMEETPREKLNFKEVEQTINSEEESFTGKVQLYEGDEWLDFRLAEGVLEIKHLGLGLQIFEME